MKTTFCAILTILAVCATLTPAHADGPFSATWELSEPGVYVYTLHNGGTAGEVAWLFDVNWVPDWDESQIPATAFTILAAPESQDWYANPWFPFAAFDGFGADPRPGESLTGFVVASNEPAAYFHVVYQDAHGGLVDQYGTVDAVPEPGSILALLCGLGGLVWGRRRKL